ncbi:LarC family nickel insertion protein [Paenibacillus radicis (ex Xue et al. 2023)]|uniref:LarC family nickel insertion protein n=1 Tax=Paenibacillus radicis (ex Xue et al. 2023) TaxID=2972489 RepID=A0ABT1YI69_9BACL|nr:LarC family nickel insertion protein [Paenibacillus radicis (ex Xue et al. 2023)]MCR8632873.1 LarC family nickel insertion protein [Paenibacillus radicis (ex Xue et al. 2023)]
MGFQHREEHVDDGMLLLQANIDDMNPELCSYVSDCLFEAGANDVYWIPIIMKKGRPGVMLNVLVDESGLERIEEVIFRETTTIGLRYLHASCHRLAREFEQVETPWGGINVKIGYHKGRLVQFAPEFKECEQAAKQYGVALKQVYEEVRRLFLNGKKR